MRIFSKFHDYYDAALAYGADERIIYHRHPEELRPIPEEWEFMRPTVYYTESSEHIHPGPKNPGLIVKGVRHELRPVVVAVAGVIHHGIGVITLGNMAPGGIAKEYYAWDFEDYVAYLKDRGIKLLEVAKKNKRRSRYGYGPDPYWMRSTYYAEGAEGWLNVERPDLWRDTFIIRKVPIATATTERYSRKWSHDDSIEFNGPLKKYQFYRKMDAYQTYQELDMFVAGTMTQEDNPMAGISDEDLARQKGFDCYSFKKMPNKRQVKECKK